ELWPEIEAVISRRVIRTVRQRHFGRGSAPRLVIEGGAIHPNQFVERIGVASLLRDEKDRRSLVREDALPIHAKFVSLGFASEDRMIVEDEAASALVLLEEHGCGESADTAANRNHVEDLAGIGCCGDAPLEESVAHRVSWRQYVPGVAIRLSIIANTPVAVERVSLRRLVSSGPIPQ